MVVDLVIQFALRSSVHCHVRFWMFLMHFKYFHHEIGLFSVTESVLLFVILNVSPQKYMNVYFSIAWPTLYRRKLNICTLQILC